MTNTEQKKIVEESYTLTEDQMKKLARNALLTAGHELGKDGDHWPVIKNTITDIMMDWEKLDQEREVDAVMKEQLYTQLEELESGLHQCTPEDKTQATAILLEIRELFDAYFTEPKVVELNADNENEEEETPIHIKRAQAILSTLMEDKDDE